MNSEQPEPANTSLRTPSPRSEHSPLDAATRASQPPAIQAETLFKGQQEILIIHNGEHYRLRMTRNHKLILTK